MISLLKIDKYKKLYFRVVNLLLYWGNYHLLVYSSFIQFCITLSFVVGYSSGFVVGYSSGSHYFNDETVSYSKKIATTFCNSFLFNCFSPNSKWTPTLHTNIPDTVIIINYWDSHIRLNLSTLDSGSQLPWMCFLC